MKPMPTTTTPETPKPTAKKSDLSIQEQIEIVDHDLSAASNLWKEQGSNPRSPLYTKTINGLLDRRTRLMEKRDGKKLLVDGPTNPTTNP